MIFQLRNGRQLFENGQEHDVVALDQANMGPVLAGLGESFDSELRRISLFNPQYVFILAWDEHFSPPRLLGYIQYGPEGEDPGCLWLHSVQIDQDYQGGPLLARLLSALALLLQKSRFKSFSCILHKVHENAMGVYRRLGFEVTRDDYSMFTFRLSAGPEVFRSPGFERMIARYGKNVRQKV